jgi:hypothetical protein
VSLNNKLTTSFVNCLFALFFIHVSWVSAFLKWSSICSNVNPLVSGTSRNVKMNETIPMAAKSQNVPDCPKMLTNPKNSSVIRKFALQLATVAMLIAVPRACKGKISEISNQKTGPNPMAKNEMYAIRLIAVIVPTAEA